MLKLRWPIMESTTSKPERAKTMAESTIRAEYAILKAANGQTALAQAAVDKAQKELERATKISDAALSKFRTLIVPHPGVYSLGSDRVLIIEVDIMAMLTGGCRWHESEVL